MATHTEALVLAGQDARAARQGINAVIDFLSPRIQERAKQVHETYDVEPIDVGAMLDQLQGAVAFNDDVQRRRRQRQEMEQEVAAHRAEVARCTQEIRALQMRRDQVETAHESLAITLQRATPIPKEIDTTVLRLAIEDAMAENGRKYDERLARRAYRDAVSDLDRAVREAEQLTAIVCEAESDELADVTPVGA